MNHSSQQGTLGEMRMANLQQSLFGGSISKHQLIHMGLLFVAILAAARLGSFLFTTPAVIQPAAGVALAGLVIGGIALWPAVVAAITAQVIIGGTPPIIALGGVLAHALHAVAGTYVLQRFGFDQVFRRVRDMFAFMVVALVGALIIPAIGITGVWLNNLLLDPDTPLRVTFFSWWAGIMIGDLILASALIRWLGKPRFTRSLSEIVEAGTVLGALAVLSYFTFWTNASEATNGVILLLYLVPFVWMALRLGVRFTFLGFVLTAAISLTGVLYGNTPSENPISERIVGMEFFMATLAVIFYLFVAVMEERKRAAGQLTAELRRASELLAASKAQDAAKSEFIAVFAHELRNPLAPIVSSLEILKLKGGSSDRTTAGAISIIEDRVQTIVRLLDDLLDVSRISRQSFKLQREEIDLRNCVHNSAASLRELVEKHGLAFEVSMPENPLLASADPIRIEQIIVNLLMNAVKYTPRGTIMLSVARDGDYAEIRVKDTGVGIAPEVIGGIFEPFASRREGTHIGMKAGLGIGLWLTKNLVSMHGGTIEAKSGGAGRGSEFIVRLPLEGVPSTVIHHVTPMQNTIEKTSKKILVVDDNEAAAKGLATLLEHVGNTVEIAYVGAEALEKVDIFNPDVVVLDIGLPDISGYEVAAALRKKGFTGSIIALTGYGQEEDKKKAAEAGFDHHLTKPVGIADLQAVLVHA